MPAVQEIGKKQIKTKKAKNGNGNGHIDPMKVQWQELEYASMVALVEKLAGPRPKLPDDLPIKEWTPQAERVLRERYYLKDKDGNAIGFSKTILDSIFPKSTIIGSPFARYIMFAGLISL
jgi:hypothetical protein